LPAASSWCSPPLFLGARRPGPRNAHGRRRHRAHSTGPGAGRSVAPRASEARGDQAAVATPTPAGLAAGAADGRRCRAAAGAESGGGAAGPGPRALEAGDSVAAAAPAPDAGAAGARATRRPEIRRYRAESRRPPGRHKSFLQQGTAEHLHKI
jgi:hypothetical protein